MTTMDIPATFQDILRRHLPYADAGGLTATDDLAALGLDSMGVMGLLTELEEDLDLDLPDALLTEETFATVGSLWTAVSALLPSGSLGNESGNESGNE